MGIPENQPQDENALLARIGNDPQTFKELFDTFFPRVYNYFRYRDAESSLADDLTAITFEQAWLGMRKFRPDSSSFKLWLFTIARDLMDEHLSFQNQPAKTSSKVKFNQPGKEPKEIQKMSQAELLRTIFELEDQPRNLLALKFTAHMTNRQIAQLNELNERDVNLNLFRALAQLEAKLENAPYPDDDFMRGQEWSNLVNFDKIVLINDTELPKGEGVLQDVNKILGLALRLERLDFSPESQIRQSLRERLAAHPPVQRWSWSRPGGVARLLSPPQAIALAVVVILLIIVVILAINGVL